MRIGILTFQRAENYGAALQCKALYTYLSECGNDVEIIDYRNETIENEYRIFPKLRKNIFLLTLHYVNSIVHYEDMVGRRSKFLNFLNSSPKSVSMTGEEVSKKDFDYDLIIVGSDQVWNPMITKGLDRIYFLTFKGEFRRAGYAISLGNINYQQFTEPEFYEYVNGFDDLSFREPDAASFVSGKMERIFPQVVDPTLLLTREQWDKIVGNVSMDIPSKYIFVYYLFRGESEQTIIRIAEHLSKQYDMPILHLKADRSLSRRFKGKAKTLIDIGPREFVYLIRNASHIVTSSFHGTALSCIYQKDVSIVIPQERGSRVKAVAEMFHLHNWVYGSYEDFCGRTEYSGEPMDNKTAEYQESLERSIDYLRQITKKV